MKANAYYNLHRHLWSIVARDGAQKGRVVAHLPRVLLADAEMIVRPAGRARVLREGRKNVHAFVRGTILPDATPVPAGARPFSYNPHEAGHFTLRDDDTRPPVRRATLVVLDGRRALALDPRP